MQTVQQIGAQSIYPVASSDEQFVSSLLEGFCNLDKIPFHILVLNIDDCGATEIGAAFKIGGYQSVSILL